jgi:hypothetical protein
MSFLDLTKPEEEAKAEMEELEKKHKTKTAERIMALCDLLHTSRGSQIVIGEKRSQDPYSNADYHKSGFGRYFQAGFYGFTSLSKLKHVWLQRHPLPYHMEITHAIYEVKDKKIAERLDNFNQEDYQKYLYNFVAVSSGCPWHFSHEKEDREISSMFEDLSPGFIMKASDHEAHIWAKGTQGVEKHFSEVIDLISKVGFIGEIDMKKLRLL